MGLTFTQALEGPLPVPPECGQSGSPVALGTAAGVAVDFIHTLGPVLTAVTFTVVLIFAAVGTCVTWHTLTPVVDRERVSDIQPRAQWPGLCNLCVLQRISTGSLLLRTELYGCGGTWAGAVNAWQQEEVTSLS